MNGRFVLIGTTNARRPWFSDIARWATSGIIAAEYTQAMSIDEVRAILASGRRVSAVVVGSTTHGLDREFIALASSLDVVVVVVADPHDGHDWDSIGATCVLDHRFSPDELRDVLFRHARPIEPTARRSTGVSIEIGPPCDLAPLVAVTGSGGSGVSTVAMALATGLGELDPADGDGARTALADLTRSGDLAMYHDVGDVIPGLPELVEAHRGDTPEPSVVRDMLFDVPGRPYQLLLGQRRSRDSAAMPPLSTAAAIDGLRRSYPMVVTDVAATFDGETETGSIDIEAFNSAQRHALSVASVVVVVSTPGMRGVRRLATMLTTLERSGVPTERIVPVWNHASRRPSTRAMLTRLTAEINPMEGATHPPLFIRHIRMLEDIHHSVGRIPSSMIDGPTGAVTKIITDHGNRPEPAPAPVSARNVTRQHAGAA